MYEDYVKIRTNIYQQVTKTPFGNASGSPWRGLSVCPPQAITGARARSSVG